jgi:hypothetical protein
MCWKQPRRDQSYQLTPPKSKSQHQHEQSINGTDNNSKTKMCELGDEHDPKKKKINTCQIVIKMMIKKS